MSFKRKFRRNHGAKQPRCCGQRMTLKYFEDEQCLVCEVCEKTKRYESEE